MRHPIPFAIAAAGLFLMIAGCAGPLGPPLGLGPGFDQAILIILLLVAAVFVYRALTQRGASPGELVRGRPTTSQAQELLRERYVRGEVSREEYLRIAEDLRTK